MTIDITVRWTGPAGATAGSRHKIERTLNWETWTILAAAQAPTAPYVSPAAALAGNVAYGAAAIPVSDDDLPASGFGVLDDAIVQWTGKSANTLTGVTWHSGYGVYAAGTLLVQTLESYVDAGVTPTNGAVVYRITHTAANGDVSAPTYFWFYYPSVPASRDHCAVIGKIGTDLGVGVRAGVPVTCDLAADNQFADVAGAHLDQAQSGVANSQTTNALGLVEFHCWKSNARSGLGGTADAAYTFTLDAGTANALTVTVADVPDRDWVLLKDVGS